MAASSITQSSDWADEMEGVFKDLQKDTFLLTIPALLVSSMFFFGLAISLNNYIWPLVMGVGLLVMVPTVQYMGQRNLLAASFVVIVLSLVAVFAAVRWGGFTSAMCLLIIPAGLTTLMLGTLAGVILAGGTTVFLLLTPSITGSFSFVEGLTSIIAIWGTVGMTSLALRPLLKAVEWSWSSYHRSVSLVEEARDYQQKLGETLEDLTKANVKLTRLNQLANNLRQIAEDERQAKQQFAANVSHELRTPLNMIIGFCELMLNVPEAYGREVPANLLADLQVVLSNSQHLAGLIDDVLDLSQIEVGQMALMKERVELAEIVRSATVSVRPLYESKHLKLEVDVPDNLPEVYCDRTRIREVLLNLLSNAGRFTDQGGVKIVVRRDGTDVLVSVKDTGQGIPEAAKNRLFQPFQQADGAIRRRFGGTGLGLSISKSFVELHDGKMWVETKEGEGTIFYFRLPIDPPLPLRDEFTRWINPYTTPQEGDRLRKLPPVDVRPRVLVVDNGGTLQRLITRFQDGIEVVGEPTLEAALNDLAHTPASALLVNSLEVVNTLRRLLEAPGLPLDPPAIVCSIPSSIPDAAALNVATYLVKPVSRDALLGALGNLGKPIRTVLLADDEPDAQQLFRRMLSSARRGYRVLRADDGQQALEILSRQEVDVVLLDLIMPNMDGFQFMTVKSQRPELREIPIIVISARDPQGHPIVSNVLTVTRRGGISAHQLLECISALRTILSPARADSGSRPQAVRPD